MSYSQPIVSQSGASGFVGVEISYTLIAQVADAVLDVVRVWQSRAMDATYPIVWLEGLVIRPQQNKPVINTSALVVRRVNLRGEKEVLGL